MPDALPPGLYESIVTDELYKNLAQFDESILARRKLRSADAADRIALHLSRTITRAIEALPEAERVDAGIRVARALVAHLSEQVPKSNAGADKPHHDGMTLRAIRHRLPDGTPSVQTEPLIPLLDTTLLTNAPGEPRVGSQLAAEVESADSIDVIMAFIRRTGVKQLQGQLRDHCAAGKRLRILTTTYTQSTERAALDLLKEFGAEIRVSYDKTSSRLHAKAWLFHRRTGFSTAYVGSSNLTHSAQVTGLEWNVRASGARNPDVVNKMAAVFESYWQNPDFVPYDPHTFDEHVRASQSDNVIQLSPLEIRLEPFQERLLELLEVARQLGHHRNLLVSATGTGKTVMAAVDYSRLRSTLPSGRLLFIAHRREILEQSLATFRHATRDYTFGELWVGGQKPARFEHVFASVQTLNASNIAHLDPRHFDIVIIDEFHHAAAESYERILSHIEPAQLLGITATPERSDGLPILHWFDDRIAAELRLWDAIDQHKLVPFIYYGLHDGTDLRDVPWRRGRGYDTAALSDVYTSDDAWARFVLAQVREHVDDPGSMRCLGFCVSVEHAAFMARHFNEHGVISRAVSGTSSPADRDDALADLRAGRIQVIFSVDIFNEGVDVPAVDVVLMLRPTESPTLFIQQLGRGLRRFDGKEYCTVLDFVGTHRKEFRFDRRYRALLNVSRRELDEAIRSGFPYLPAGCHMQLDRIAADVVLRNLKSALPNRWPEKVSELRQLLVRAPETTLRDFLSETGLELTDVYDNNRGWSDLCEQAGATIEPAGPHEKALRRGVGRLLHLDDLPRLAALQGLLSSPDTPQVHVLSEYERRVARMLTASLASTVLRDESIQSGLDLVWAHPQVIADLRQLFSVLTDQIAHVQHPLHAFPEVPLRIHARYSRIEILAAFGEGTGAKTPVWQEGVYFAKQSKADLLAFTLDKTSGEFSPSTRYRDYAISQELIHWESQSATKADSPTGVRYQRHSAEGSAIMLFARLRKDDRAFWFLGPANYVSHVGEQPMAITWRLHTPLPGDLYTAFAAAVA